MIIFSFVFLALLAMLTWRRPTLALTVLVAMVPAYGVRFSLGGVPTTLLELSIWVTFFVWFPTSLKLRRASARWPSLKAAISPANPFAAYVLPITLWLIVATAAVTYSPNLAAALGVWKAYFVEPLMVLVMLVLTFKNHEERWWLVAALGVTTIAMSLLAWYQHFTGDFLPIPWDTNVPRRATAWFSYPNAVGLFIAPVLPMYAVWLLREIKTKSSWKTAYALTVLVLGFGAIIFSITKGAWVGAAAGCFVGALLVLRSHWKKVFTVGAVLAVAVLLIAPLRTRLLDEFLLRSPSGQIRKVVWQETVALLKDHPIEGAGLAGYQTALVPYHNPWHKEITPYAIEIFLYPHNVVLNFWVELGLAGVIVFVWLLVAFFKQAWRKRDTMLAQMAMAAMVALLVHGLVDVPYFKNDLAILFWIIVALPLLEPTTHRAHRDAKWFDLIVSGQKTVEARLYDQKRQAFHVGDFTILERRPDGQETLAQIIDLHRAPTFKELLAMVDPVDLGFENAEQGFAEIRKYYTEEDERRNGVVGIRIRLV